MSAAWHRQRRQRKAAPLPPILHLDLERFLLPQNPALLALPAPHFLAFGDLQVKAVEHVGEDEAHLHIRQVTAQAVARAEGERVEGRDAVYRFGPGPALGAKLVGIVREVERRTVRRIA